MEEELWISQYYKIYEMLNIFSSFVEKQVLSFI